MGFDNYPHKRRQNLSHIHILAHKFKTCNRFFIDLFFILSPGGKFEINMSETFLPIKMKYAVTDVVNCEP